jgi:signal transduction histidine kinase
VTKLGAYGRSVRERPDRPDLWQVLRGLLLLVFTMVGTAGASHGGSEDALHDMNALGYLLAFLAAAPFLTVTMLPLPSLAVSAAAVSTYMAIGYSFGPVIVALALVTIVAAASTPTSRALAVFVPIAAVVTTGLTIRFARDPDESGWVALLAGIAWIGAPWAIGAFIRLRSEGRVRTRREEAARAADAERLRIAAEVHDVAGHGLAVIAMQAGVALHVLDRKPEQARIALEEIRATSTEALDGLRATLASLRTPGAEAPLTPGLPGLADLPALVERITRAGVPVELATSGQAVPVPADVDHTAYRIVQESLTNVLRHANAERARVTTAWAGDGLTVTVLDDGRGAPGAEGSGIAGMRARVEAVGGTLRAAPAAGGGFEVVATLPLAAP